MTPRESADEHAALDAAFYEAREKGRRCCWYMDRGYGKGRPCGNDAKFLALGDAFFCPVHFGIAQDPKRRATQADYHLRCRATSAVRLADMRAAELSEREPATDHERAAVSLAIAKGKVTNYPPAPPRPEDLRVVDRPAAFIWYTSADPTTGTVVNCMRRVGGWEHAPVGDAPVILAWIRGAR